MPCAGGDALASDLMWREIQLLAQKKPLVASMGDVAASGGYYMSMAAPLVVAQPLTITGSIGVVTGKFNLAELFDKVALLAMCMHACSGSDLAQPLLYVLVLVSLNNNRTSRII
jgi:enoyl-CoA hydratase/carnithine racemase